MQYIKMIDDTLLAFLHMILVQKDLQHVSLRAVSSQAFSVLLKGTMLIEQDRNLSNSPVHGSLTTEQATFV